MNPTLHLSTVCLLFATCAGAPAPNDAAAAKLEEARRLLAEGDPDAALAITDHLTRDHGSWKDAWVVAGEGNLALARLERPSLDPDFVRRDAEAAFLRATAIDENDARAWLGLAQARFDLRAHDSARAAAERAAELGATNHEPATAIAAALRIAAECDLQQLIVVRQQELQSGTADARGIVPIERGTLELAQRAIVRFEAIQPVLPDAGFRGTAQVYQWVGQDDEALKELERGIRSAPDAGEVHVAFQDLHVRLGQQRALAGVYSRILRDLPGVPILLWYQGRAEVVAADDQRSKQNFQAAAAGYQHAVECYGQYAAMVPEHRENAGQWIAICELSLARVAADGGDNATAEKHLFAAAEASPLATAYDGMEPRLRDSFGNHFANVVAVIGRALATGGADSLQQTLAFHERVIARCPQQWGFVYNNGALAARDLGVLRAREAESRTGKEREAAMTAAMALWEQSYGWYEEAAKLSPDDARIQNDTGLMLVYYLNRDFDRARALFDRAIAIGQPQIDALPADAPETERNDREEAVGDAYQNIAVLMQKHLKAPFDAVKPFLQRALQYYPRAEREAAQMLLRGERPADAVEADGQGAAAEAFAKVRAEVEEAAKQNDLDAAMAALDRAVKDLRGYAPFQVLRGDYALRYAKAARDEGRRGVDALFADAVDALQKAVELDSDPAAPRLLLAEAQYESSQFAAVARTITDLLLHLQSKGGGTDQELATAHRLRGVATGKWLLADSQGDHQQDIAAARTSFRWLDGKKLLDAQLRTAWAEFETAAKATAEAVAIYSRALADKPDDQALLAAVVDTAVAGGDPKLAVDALQKRNDAAGLWYLGRARFCVASDLRTAGRIDDAIAELDRARTCFEQSMGKNKDFADSCQQWVAICLGKKGNAYLAQKKWDDAEKWLVEAGKARPDQVNQDLGLQETIKIGVLKLADHYFQQEDLAKTEAVYNAVVAHVQSDIDLLNNAGLFARDYGAQLDRDGKTTEAKALFERSYAAYQKANALDPQNVQLANDTALMAIQYLGIDWDQSKKMLEAAITEGESRLQSMSNDDAARPGLVSAVGDCWENVALWHLRRDQDYAAAKTAAETAMKYPPPQGQRSGARRHLQAAEKGLQDKEKK